MPPEAVAYQMAVAATLTGAFSWASAPNRFLYVGFGGIVLGLVLGVFLSRIRTKLEHRPVEIITSLLSPFVVYIAAEHLQYIVCWLWLWGLSGVARTAYAFV